MGMTENIYRQRIEALRGLMKENGIHAYLIVSNDFHASEYVGDYFKCRAYMSGFTGSAGTLAVTLGAESGAVNSILLEGPTEIVKIYEV